MRFKRYHQIEQGLDRITIAPLITVVFLVFAFFVLASSFASPDSIKIKLPKAITSDFIKEENLAVTITSEDVIYLGNIIVTIPELNKELSKPANRTRPLLIKADRRTSVGRVVEVWDLCRTLGFEKINIATSQGK